MPETHTIPSPMPVKAMIAIERALASGVNGGSPILKLMHDTPFGIVLCRRGAGQVIDDPDCEDLHQAIEAGVYRRATVSSSGKPDRFTWMMLRRRFCKTPCCVSSKELSQVTDQSTEERAANPGARDLHDGLDVIDAEASGNRDAERAAVKRVRQRFGQEPSCMSIDELNRIIDQLTAETTTSPAPSDLHDMLEVIHDELSGIANGLT